MFNWSHDPTYPVCLLRDCMRWWNAGVSWQSWCYHMFSLGEGKKKATLNPAKVIWRPEIQKNSLFGVLSGSSFAPYGQNHSDDITLLFPATPNTPFTQTHAFSWFPADPMPKGRRVAMATLVQRRGFGLLFLWARWMGSDNPTPLTSTTQLISGISVSLQMTDWITPVPPRSSHFLIPPSSYFVSAGPPRLRVHSVLLSISLLVSLWKAQREAPIIQRSLGTWCVRCYRRWKAVTFVSMELYKAWLGDRVSM